MHNDSSRLPIQNTLPNVHSIFIRSDEGNNFSSNNFVNTFTTDSTIYLPSPSNSDSSSPEVSINKGDEFRSPLQLIEFEKSEPIVRFLAQARKIGMDVIFPQSTHDKVRLFKLYQLSL